MFARLAWLTTAILMLGARAPAAFAQKTAAPCDAPPGTVLVATGAGVHPDVTGVFPGLYGPAGERASEQFQDARGAAALRFHSVVQLITMTGTYAAPRRVEIGENERFDLGELKPGHYMVRVDFSFRGPVVGEFDVKRMPVMLCLALPNNPWAEDSVVARAASPSIHPLATHADSVAIGAAVGEYFGSRMPDPQPPFALLGAPDALISAARHAYMVARGDSVPPASVRVASGAWTTLSIDKVDLANRDSALVTTLFAGCRPGNTGINSSAQTRTYAVVRRPDQIAWTVTASTGPVQNADGYCR